MNLTIKSDGYVSHNQKPNKGTACLFTQVHS